MGTNLVGLLLPDLATVTSALEVLGCSPWALFLEMFLSDSLFLGGGITGRGGSLGMSGSSLRFIPNTSKGSGDPKPNFIRIINFVCTPRPHTHTEMDAQFFRIFPQFFVADALFYVADVQFYVKLVLFVMFRKFLPKITILIKIVVYLCVVFQGWLLFPLSHV